MPHFPLFITLSGRDVLVIGGGAVACRKLRSLSAFGPRLTVVAPDILPEAEALPGTICLRRPYAPGDEQGRTLVVVASGCRQVNALAARRCREAGIPVNVADAPEESTFLFPALVQRGRMTVGISTDGAAPAASAWLRGAIDELIPDRMEDILAFLDTLRTECRPRITEQRQRASLLRHALALCLEKERPLTPEETETLYISSKEDIPHE